MKLKFCDSQDRSLQEGRNRRYLLFYDLIFCLIYGVMIISVDAEAKASVAGSTYMIVFCFIAALIFRDLLMTIPTWILLRPVYPEIHLTDDSFIFIGGSEVLNYSPMIRFTAFSTSYYKTTPNLSLPRNAAFDVDIVHRSKGKSRLTWRNEREVQIKAGKDVINMLGWLSLDQQQKVKNAIEEWKSHSELPIDSLVSISVQGSETPKQFLSSSLQKQLDWIKPVWRVLVVILILQLFGMAIGIQANLTGELFLNLWYGGAYATPVGFILGLVWHAIAVPNGLYDNRFMLLLLGAMSLAMPIFGALTFGIWKLSAMH